MNEAGAIEEDVDRPDFARERFDRLGRAGVELALVGVEACEAAEVDVRRDDVRALARKGLGSPAPDARRRRRQQRHLTRQSSRHVGRSFRLLSSGRRGRAKLLGDIAARS